MVFVMSRIALVAKPVNPNTGVGRYVHTLLAELAELDSQPLVVSPTIPPLPGAVYAGLRRLGIDLGAFLANYPVWASYPEAEAYHFTSQNLATLLLFRRPPGKAIVTVHDILPYMLRDNTTLSTYRTLADRIFDRLAMFALKRADLLVADSEYTKRCLIEQLGIAPEKIEVALLAVDHERFRPLAVPESIRLRYGLPEGRRYLIYVGSEDPRKNVPTLVKSLG